MTTAPNSAEVTPVSGTDTFTAARHWEQAGACLIPIRVDGSKAPDGLWKDFQENRSTPEQHQHWFGNGTAHGIGIIHGKVSGNSEVIDFDLAGLFPLYKVRCIEAGYADLMDRLVHIQTPSGGDHVQYRCEEPVTGNQKLAQHLENAEEGADGARLIQGRWVKIKTLIETRGEGGYTLAPGSPASCHPSNRPYKFLSGRPATIPVITAEERTALLAIAATFNEYVDTNDIVDAPTRGRMTPSDENTRTGDGLRPGDDYNSRGDYEALLEGSQWRRLGYGGDKGVWQRPGKSGRGISATSNYGGAGLFYVFSSNASLFEPLKAYTPFAVYTLLEHGGDFKSAAKKLREGGYGSPASGLNSDYKNNSDYKQSSIQSNNTQSGSTKKESAVAASPVAAQDLWPEASPLMFHGLAGEIVHVIDPHTEADPVALLVQLLAAFGSAVGRSAHFKAEADKHYGNVFAVMVGVSAKGRKGTSWGHIQRLFALADARWESDCVQSGLSSGEGLIWHVRDAIEKPVKNKTTGEVELETVDPGIEDKRLLILESEYASVLRVASRDGNTLSAILRDAWDRGRLQTMTKNNAAKATDAHVSLVGHVTADELRRELSSTEAGNGFANRFLWVCARRSKELPEGGNLTEAALYSLATRLSEAIENGRHVGLMVRDEDARALWHAVYHDLSEGGPGLSGAVTSRAEAQTMRLALLYALLDESDCIQREHLMAALALWEYTESSARYVFGDSLGDPVADDILRALQNAPEGLNRTDLTNLFGRHQPSNRIGQALALLQKHGRAQVIQEQTGGRPIERWLVV